MMLPSLSSHCSLDDEMVSLCASFALISSFLCLIFLEYLSKPFFRISRGFIGIVGGGILTFQAETEKYSGSKLHFHSCSAAVLDQCHPRYIIQCLYNSQ